MNDSFLEDLDLIPEGARNVKNKLNISNRYVTTRKVLSPPSNIHSQSDNNIRLGKQDKIISSSASNIKTKRRSDNLDSRKLSIPEQTKPLSSTPKSDKKNKDSENLLNPGTEEVKTKAHDKIITKLQDDKTGRNYRKSGNSVSSSRYLDASSKENTRPSTDTSSSRESGNHVELRKEQNRRISDGSSRKSDLLEKTDPVMLLNAIKDIVSRYTEQETVKVLRSMQDLHMNSQSNLIKLLMLQTDELIKEQNIHKNNDSIKSLIEENEKMREDNVILRARIEVLQKKINEMSLMRMMKEENIINQN